MYVNEKFFFNKTLYLDLFNAVLIVFPYFNTACKMCIEVVVWNILHLGESWGCRKGAGGLLPIGGFGS